MAFEVAVAKVIGDDAHGITLQYVRGGYAGTVDPEAKGCTLFMTCKALTMTPPGRGLRIAARPARCGGANAPWGVTPMTVLAPPPGVAQKNAETRDGVRLEGGRRGSVACVHGGRR